MSSDFCQLNPMLAAQIDNQQLSHAYIFQGDESREQAITFAATLNCMGEVKPCEHCPVCMNMIAGTYPDCRFIEPDKGTHRIEGMKAMAAQAQLSAANMGWKIFILNEAEKMSDEAANNLLKLLEEPPPKTVFILITSQSDQMLETILSRCQLFVFGKKFGKQEDETDLIAIDEAEDLLIAMPGMQIYEILVKARELDKREDQRSLLLSLLIVLHKAATGHIKLPMEYPALIRSETMIESSLELIDNNINQKLLMDVVYLRLWQNCQR